MTEKILERERCYSIVGAFFEVFHCLGPGLPEVIYSKALEYELRKRGHKVVRELIVQIWYKGYLLGTKRLDIVVDDRIIVEVKAREKLSKYDEVQIKTYLKVTRFEVGLLLHASCIANWKRFIDTPKGRHRHAPIARARASPE
jgi:GxxExxY protein